MKKSKNCFSIPFQLFKFGSVKGQNDEDWKTIAAQEQKLFTFEALVAATKNFHPNHKLGEGGFGPVYKGKLGDGREIAVKKLSHSSHQGKKEFINEARLLSRVQHRNIVSLVGYCIHGEEKLLVYEYVRRESLDKLLFKPKRREELNWNRRLEIITGIARGLLYLHEDAPCCIIHRDIKASNILLDENWVPKIADFGMARLFSEEETNVKTRVAGTNGYMAPEYVMRGQLSVKADVFSFGILVLETISGQRNYNFKLDVDAQNLLDWAYKMYKEGRGLEIMDSALASSAEPELVTLCIRIGLLCAQADPQLRPNMQRVLVMLSRKGRNLEEPGLPAVPGSSYKRAYRHHHGSSSAPGTSSGSNTTSLNSTTTPSASTSTIPSLGLHHSGNL